jgi:hypothetical protein
MKYVISIQRMHDGEKVAHMFDDYEVSESNIDVIAMRANELWKAVNLLPEKKLETMEDWLTKQGRESMERHRAKQILYPSNPVEDTPFMKRLREMAKMTPYQREAHQKMERLQREGFEFKFTQQTLNTFEESGDNNGNDPQTD